MKKVKGRWYSPHQASKFKLYPGVGAAVKKAKALGFKAILITNQPDVSRGLMPRKELDAMNRKLRKAVPLDDVFMCLHDNADKCACRKPKPGLLKMAAKKWKISLRESFFVGDTWRDVYAGHAVGVRTVWIRNNREDYVKFWKESAIRYNESAKNLAQAVRKIEKMLKKEKRG